ncbi:MAG: TonB-dependent receptor plug domain-containing protein, partial [Draconibacterium sp.]|nr:TonB-dependent receptor plug domain-containing protein [Draconibacterium sp.]
MRKVFLVIISSLFSLLLSAQDLDTIRIKEVVIEASTINYKVIKLDKKFETAKSTGELMQQIPGVTITKRSSFAIEPSINNFKYDQINTTINGGMSASNSCPNRMDPITTRISPDEIKTIEVVRGPFEVKYGQIMGGFINLITNENPNYKQFNIDGNIASEYNFNGNGKIVSANIKT